MKFNFHFITTLLLFSFLLFSTCKTKKTHTSDTAQTLPKKTTTVVVDPQTQTPIGECIDRNKIKKNQACPRNYEPVCGCNDKTYSNACEAEKAGVTKFTKGQCNDGCIDQTKINREFACMEVYAPVCGCNGKTYPNECYAEHAGVLKTFRGDCKDCIDKSKIDKNRGCPEDWNPVCGCNAKTYGNECEAKRDGIKRWKPGECKKKN